MVARGTPQVAIGMSEIKEHRKVQREVLAALVNAAHQPPVDVLARWYF